MPGVNNAAIKLPEQSRLELAVLKIGALKYCTLKM